MALIIYHTNKNVTRSSCTVLYCIQVTTALPVVASHVTRFIFKWCTRSPNHRSTYEYRQYGLMVHYCTILDPGIDECYDLRA